MSDHRPVAGVMDLGVRLVDWGKYKEMKAQILGDTKGRDAE
jgi:hypothetical protein